MVLSFIFFNKRHSVAYLSVITYRSRELRLNGDKNKSKQLEELGPCLWEMGIHSIIDRWIDKLVVLQMECLMCIICSYYGFIPVSNMSFIFK